MTSFTQRFRTAMLGSAPAVEESPSPDGCPHGPSHCWHWSDDGDMCCGCDIPRWLVNATERCAPATHEPPGDGRDFPCWACRIDAFFAKNDVTA